MLVELLANLSPELFLGLSLSALLVWGSIVSVNEAHSPRVGWVVSALSFGVLFIVVIRLSEGLTFDKSVYVTSDTSLDGINSDIRALTLKLLMVLATMGCLLVVTRTYNKSETNKNDLTNHTHHTHHTEPAASFEYPILRLLALLGRRLLVSAEDLMVFYLALELQSLSLYVLAASGRGSAYSTEAGLKYFRLGAFASGIFLLGSSLIYGYLGTTNYTVISELLSTPIDAPQLVTGFLLIVVAISFKLAAAPFHRWSPDVREGSPATSGRFFASVTKIAALGALGRLCFGPFYGLWRNSIGFRPFVIRSGLSMRVGALAAMGQRRLKRFLAYSAIGHMGFMLRGIASGSFEGLQATIIYLSLYVIGSLTRWSVVVGSGTQYFTDLGGLARRQPALASVIAISMFSRAGIPPMAGFMAKLSVLFAARQSSMVYSRYRLAVFSIRISVVGAYYYLRIIKIRYFAPANHTEDSNSSKRLTPIDTGSAWRRAITTYITVFVLLNPTLLYILIERATLI